MTCKHTELLVSDLFDEAISQSQRTVHENHLHDCAECQLALADAESVTVRLSQWREQAVPAWNRGAAVAQNDKAPTRHRIFSWWQWTPLAASLMLAMAVIFNVQISSTEEGFTVAFGNKTQMSAADVQMQLELFEARQERNNTQLMATVMTSVVDRVVEQFEASNSRSLEQVMAYVDGQRQQDMQALQSSYQQLADSDYQTIRSVQQLASYVQYQTE